jgi:hypothetical protein
MAKVAEVGLASSTWSSAIGVGARRYKEKNRKKNGNKTENYWNPD